MTLLEKNNNFLLLPALKKELSLGFFYAINPGFSLEFNKRLPIVVILQAFQGFSEQDFLSHVLPGCSFVEKNAFYLNFHGKVQISRAFFSPLGFAKPDWQILDLFNTLFVKKICMVAKIKVSLGKKFNSTEAGHFENSTLISPLRGSATKINKLLSRTTQSDLNIYPIFYKTFMTNFLANFYFVDSTTKMSRLLNLCSKNNASHTTTNTIF